VVKHCDLSGAIDESRSASACQSFNYAIRIDLTYVGIQCVSDIDDAFVVDGDTFRPVKPCCPSNTIVLSRDASLSGYRRYIAGRADLSYCVVGRIGNIKIVFSVQRNSGRTVESRFSTCAVCVSRLARFSSKSCDRIIAANFAYRIISRICDLDISC
jgi:hypothetical protein